MQWWGNGRCLSKCREPRPVSPGEPIWDNSDFLGPNSLDKRFDAIIMRQSSLSRWIRPRGRRRNYERAGTL
jgi:hypothetical protein